MLHGGSSVDTTGLSSGQDQATLSPTDKAPTLQRAEPLATLKPSWTTGYATTFTSQSQYLTPHLASGKAGRTRSWYAKPPGPYQVLMNNACTGRY